MGKVLALIIVCNVVCGMYSAFLAHQKNRFVVWWFFLGLTTGVLGLLTVGFLPDRRTKSSEKICAQCRNQLVWLDRHYFRCAVWKKKVQYDHTCDRFEALPKY